MKDLALWTRRDTALLIVIALLPVIVYQVFDQKWLRLPWLPIAVVGTAVAFIISFQNNATYDRVWEARKIWGAIVNASRTFGVREDHYSVEDELSPSLSKDALSYVLSKSNPAAQIVSLQGKSERIKNFPYPRQYATLNWVFLWLSVPITTIARGVEIDIREMLDEDPETIPPPIEAQYDTQT